jgi:hypothetical protein
MSNGIAKRQCNGCTLCCFTHQVRIGGESKPEFSNCYNCDGGKCLVYHTAKPRGCDDWDCAWKLGQWGSDADCPKMIGVVPEWKHTIQGRTLVLFGATEEALIADRVQRIVRQYAQERVPILLRFPSGKKRIVFEQGILVPLDIKKKAVEEGVEIAFIETRY